MERAEAGESSAGAGREPMTSLEKRLLFVLADMVFQHCHAGMADIMSPECVFDSGFVRCNKDAIEILIGSHEIPISLSK